MTTGPLRIALCFHFNQNLNQFGAVASRAGYRGLLNVLRRHARLPFAIHISGTLVHALQWLDPEPLQLIADGLAAGQFTLLGSTYAQNVPYATDDWDNLLQIALHRDVLQRSFGVSPAIFWNSERCWRQSLVPVIADSGYTHTLVEGSFLRAAGCAQPHAVWRTGFDGRQLTVFNDDEGLKHAINYAIWTGRPQRALAYLERLATAPDHDTYYIWYAEDAEASGLWGYTHGILPQSAWANLDQLLTLLEQQPWLAVTAPTQGPVAQGEVPVIPDGQASWMVTSLQRSGAPYHEDGFVDWFDYIDRSPKLGYFRSVQAQIRQRLQASQTTPPGSPAAGRLVAQAHLAYAAHQYEFGCIGVGRRGDRQWEMMRAALVSLRAAALATGAPAVPVWMEDVNDDGVDEVLLASRDQFIVLTPLGGRVLYAYDLAAGVAWVGNENAMSFAPYEIDAAYPVGGRTFPARWLPDTFEPSVEGFSAVDADPRTVWARYLPDDWWAGEPATLPTWRVPDLPSGAAWSPMPAQTRAHSDRLWIDGVQMLAPDGNLAWQVRLEDQRVIFVLREGACTVEKTFQVYEGGLEALYRITIEASQPVEVRLEIENELCPSYVDLIDAGRAAVAYWDRYGRPVAEADGDTRGVINRAARYLTVFQAQPAPVAVRGQDGLLALTVTPVFEWMLPPGTAAVLGLRWRAMPIETT